MREFRTRPEQAGKGAVEVSKAAGEAWSFFTQEEKDVSLLASCLSLTAINIVI